MEIKKVITGVLDENCYILIKDEKCIIIDPGDDYPKIKEVIGDNKILAVLITHAHFDHIGALRNFLVKRSIKIFKKSNLQEKKYEVGPFQFEALYTPGHSKDSVSYYFEENNALFDGDFIFKESIGRSDLPGGNPEELKNSIKKLLEKFPNNIEIYPGHNEETTLQYEKEHNIYLNL